MFKKLEELLNNSYSPYSGFRVASIVVDKDGNEYKGVNVESAAYSTTNCAERVAIQSAVANGMQAGDLVEVHLLASKTNGEDVGFAAPCGSCRQVINEIGTKETKVIIYNTKGETKNTTIDELLPLSFGSDNLNV